MIEGDRLPIACCVARLALVSVRPFMGVVFFVAGITIQGSVFKGWRQMAFLAFHPNMFPNEREPRFVVVERRFLPRPIIMAVLALRALLTLMFIVFLMTGIAVHRGVLIPIV